MNHQSYDEIVNQLPEEEKEVLLLIVDGSSYNQISDSLQIPIATVKTYRRNILKKLLSSGDGDDNPPPAHSQYLRKKTA